MDKLSFESGLKEFEINNDPNKILRFNPTDPGLIGRIQKCITDIGSGFEANQALFDRHSEGTPLDYDETMKTLEGLNNIEQGIREAIDKLLGHGTCETVFGTETLLACAGGHFVWENFLKSVIAICTGEIQVMREEAEEKIAPYTEKYELREEQNPSEGGQEQRVNDDRERND